MEIKINIDKKHFLVLLSVIVLLIVVGITIAGSYVNPGTKIGHDANELGSGTIQNTLTIDGANQKVIIVEDLVIPVGEPGDPQKGSIWIE